MVASWRVVFLHGLLCATSTLELTACVSLLQTAAPHSAAPLCLPAQLCQEHGISKDGMLEDFATQVSLSLDGLGAVAHITRAGLCTPHKAVAAVAAGHAGANTESASLDSKHVLLPARKQEHTQLAVLLSVAGWRQEGCVLLPSR